MDLGDELASPSPALSEKNGVAWMGGFAVLLCVCCDYTLKLSLRALPAIPCGNFDVKVNKCESRDLRYCSSR